MYACGQKKWPVSDGRLPSRAIMVAVCFVGLATLTACAGDDGISVLGVTDGGVIVSDGEEVIGEGPESSAISLERLEEILSESGGTVSSDGGGTWAQGSIGQQTVRGGGESVETPRGTYTLDGPHIVVTRGGEQRAAYSTEYLDEKGNSALLEQATGGLGRRSITTHPLVIVYEERSGNVVAAMGIQGVLVESQDGKWSQVAVGEYVPVDFSLMRKLLLLRNPLVTSVALALVSSLIVFSVVVSTGPLKVFSPGVLVFLGVFGGCALLSVAYVRIGDKWLYLPIVLSALSVLVLILMGTRSPVRTSEPHGAHFEEGSWKIAACAVAIVLLCVGI